MTSTSAPSPVARVRSNPSLTPLDDITGLQRVIDDLRRDIATLTTENRRLMKEIARLKDDNNRLYLERSEYEYDKEQMGLNKELEKARKSHGKKSLIWAPLYLSKVEM